MQVVRTTLKTLAMLTLVGCLSACKVELFSAVPEAEANEMVALLLANGVEAEKGSVDKGVVPLSVDSANLSAAIEILNQNGYPRDSFTDLGAMFGDQGLISSPTEERVRYVYGLSQAISETLTQIDGVITARVHIVMPEPDALTGEVSPSTASVFIKTRSGFNMDDKISSVKELVQASVQGLNYENVVVASFEADPPKNELQPGPPTVSVLGLRVPADQQGDLILWGGLGGLVVLLLLIGNVILVVRMLRPAPRSNQVSVRDA